MIERRLACLGAALPSLVLAAPALADAEPAGGRYYGHMWDGGWGMMGAGSMILFWVLIIVLIVVAVRWLSAQGGVGGGGAPNALKTLEDRLAKGEIDVAEFDERKKALTA